MTYSEKLIGKWVQRKEAEPLHKVESVIEGELVTNCGRKLSGPGYQDITGKVMQLPRYCEQCRPN